MGPQRRSRLRPFSWCLACDVPVQVGLPVAQPARTVRTTVCYTSCDSAHQPPPPSPMPAVCRDTKGRWRTSRVARVWRVSVGETERRRGTGRHTERQSRRFEGERRQETPRDKRVAGGRHTEKETANARDRARGQGEREHESTRAREHERDREREKERQREGETERARARHKAQHKAREQRKSRERERERSARARVRHPLCVRADEPLEGVGCDDGEPVVKEGFDRLRFLEQTV